MSSSVKLNLVVAVCNNMGIGIEGRLPWRLKQDMAFFKNVTTATKDSGKKNMVLMGRKTWLSIPEKFRPLSGRVNVILSSQMSETPEGSYVARNFDEALDLASKLQTLGEVESIFVIGGGSVYNEAMQRRNPCRIFLTRVLSDFTCDAFFPAIDTNIFMRSKNPEDQSMEKDSLEENGLRFSIKVYEKKF